MTWFITGGCGFVGTNLADTLLSSGEQVVLLDNLHRVGSRDNLAWLRSRHGTEWRFVEEDIRNSDAVARLVRETKPKALAHLAGQVAMTTSLQNPRLDFEINALGTLNVLEAVRQFSPSTIVLYSSTNKVYGDLEWVQYEECETRYMAPDYPDGFDESIPLSFYSPYGCSKGSADQYMLDYARMYGLCTVVFRHSSMYGGRQFATFDQGWIGWFCMKILEQLDPNVAPFTISGNGKQVRDVLYTEDFISAYVQAARSATNSPGQVYNIGGGNENSLSLLELFLLLQSLVGIQPRFRQIGWRQSDQKVFVADYRKAQRQLGWFPRINKVDGISRMLDWSRRLGEFPKTGQGV